MLEILTLQLSVTGIGNGKAVWVQIVAALFVIGTCSSGGLSIILDLII